MDLVRRAFRVCLLLCCCAANCDPGPGPDCPDPTNPFCPIPDGDPESIELSHSTLTFSSLGASQQVSSSVKDASGNELSGETVSWSTSNASVATVAATGLVTSVANGTATVTAEVVGHSSIKDSVAVTVQQVPSSAELSETAIQLIGIGSTRTLTVTVKDAGGSAIEGASLSWSSSATGVATVSNAGVVTAAGAGNATISVQATYGGGSASANATVAVFDELSIVTTEAGSGVVGVAYEQLLAATGGDHQYTWEISAGGLPAGLEMSATTGTISGTPTGTGSSTFTVRVSTGEGQSATRQLTIDVYDPLVIGTSSLPAVLVGTSYDESVAAAGGDGTVTWSVSAGSLPAGLTLNTASGAITGTPTASGTATFTITATSGDGQTESQEFTIEVYAVLTITTAYVESGMPGTAYQAALAATGGDGSYTWTVTEGSLPTGITLADASGVLSGTMGTPESQTFTVQVASGDGQTATHEYTLVVANLFGRWVDAAGEAITTASVGSQVRFQLCYAEADMVAFQARIGGFADHATLVAHDDLDSGGSGVHPDCAATTDVLDAGFTSSGADDPVTALIMSTALAPGTGPAGVFEITFTLTAAGTLALDMPVDAITASDFSGSGLTVLPGIHRLTIN